MENGQKPREAGQQEPQRWPGQDAAVRTTWTRLPLLSWVSVSLAPGRSPIPGQPAGCVQVMGQQWRVSGTRLDSVDWAWSPTKSHTLKDFPLKEKEFKH